MSYVNYHAVFLNLSNRRCLVVGGGPMAVEKIHGLLEADALITVIAQKVDPRIGAWAGEGKIEWLSREFSEEDVEPYFLAFGATEDLEINQFVSKAAMKRNRLANAVDDPEYCNFILAAMAKQGPVQVAVSTAGCSPALAQRVRNRIASEVLERGIGELAEFLGHWRPAVKESIEGYPQRKAFWERVLASDIPQILETEGWDTACAAMDHFMKGDKPAKPTRTTGFVTLAGAGPGDPGLITAKALYALRKADVVLFDRLVNPALLSEVPEYAICEYVGKALGEASMPRQTEINKRLVEYARQGKRVVRLKGGDPFVFGRGGEEMEALRTADIPFEVIPGVSAAVAAPGAAQIPVTHRGLASAFGVFAGREGVGQSLEKSHWQAAALMPTAVFLMGVEKLPTIAENLIKHGRDPETPVAVISQGTLVDQEVVTGTLSNIAEAAKNLKAPAAIIVGQTVTLAQCQTAKSADAQTA